MTADGLFEIFDLKKKYVALTCATHDEIIVLNELTLNLIEQFFVTVWQEVKIAFEDVWTVINWSEGNRIGGSVNRPPHDECHRHSLHSPSKVPRSVDQAHSHKVNGSHMTITQIMCACDLDSSFAWVALQMLLPELLLSLSLGSS